jgi:hypothetical protein
MHKHTFGHTRQDLCDANVRHTCLDIYVCGAHCGGQAQRCSCHPSCILQLQHQRCCLMFNISYTWSNGKKEDTTIRAWALHKATIK